HSDIVPLSLHDALPISGLLKPNLSMERAISWICRGECVRAFLGLVAKSLIGRKVTLPSREEFCMRTEPRIALCRCYEKAPQSDRSEEHTSELQSPDHLV